MRGLLVIQDLKTPLKQKLLVWKCSKSASLGCRGYEEFNVAIIFSIFT